MQHFWQIAFYAVIVLSILCIPVQRRALNKIAFGRSMFIAYTGIVMGYMLGVLSTSIATTVLAVVIFLLGIAMLMFMALKSIQRLRMTRKHAERADHL